MPESLERLAYRASFDLSLAPSRPVLERIQDVLAGWLSSRGADASRLQAWCRAGGRWCAPNGDVLAISRVSTGKNTDFPRVFALRMEWRDDLRRWKDDFVMERKPEKIVFRVTSRVVFDATAGREATVRGAPACVSGLLGQAGWTMRAGCVRLEAGARRASSPAQEILDWLGHPDRRCPIVVVSRHPEHGTTALGEGVLAGALAGAALVVVPVDARADHDLRAALDPSHRYEPHSVRAYLPAPAFGDPDDAARHPQWSAAKLLRMEESAAVECVLRELAGACEFAPGAIASIEDVDRLQGTPSSADLKPGESRRFKVFDNSRDVRTSLSGASNADLLRLIESSGDRLPPDAATEIMLPHRQMKRLFRDILVDASEWNRKPIPWKAIHSFRFFLDVADVHPDDESKPGRSVEDDQERWALLREAVAFAHARGLDRTYLADLPLILAGQGPWVCSRLAAYARDSSLPERERRIFVMALADAARREGAPAGPDDERFPDRAEDDPGPRAYVDAIRDIADTRETPPWLRGFAARRLLDWVRPRDKACLLQAAVAQRDSDFYAEVLPEEVEEAYARGTPDFTAYIRNWNAIHYHDAPAEGSWREAEIRRVLAAARPHFAKQPSDAGGPEALEATAALMLDVLVGRRLCAPRWWRLYDVSSFVVIAVGPGESPKAGFPPRFAENAARFIEICALRELIEIGRPREMAAWLRLRSERIQSLLESKKA